MHSASFSRVCSRKPGVLDNNAKIERRTVIDQQAALGVKDQPTGINGLQTNAVVFGEPFELLAFYDLQIKNRVKSRKNPAMAQSIAPDSRCLYQSVSTDFR